VGGRLHPAVAATRVAVRHCLADLPAGRTVLVAVSGGADSVALAAATAFEGPRAGLRAGAVTVDHGLQAGSADRAQQVVALARELGLDPVDVCTVSVGRDGGPEAAARVARYAALDAAAETNDAAAVLLGHTLDDQAETVLLGLARGSGPRSLAGMAASRGRYRRPFLELRRADTAAACAALGLPVWQDPHNADPAFTRSRVRTEVLPALEDVLGPGVAQALARTARLLRDDDAALETWAAREHTDDVAALAALPAAVRGRVLRRLLLDAGVPAGALAAAHLDAVDALVTAWHGQGAVHLPGGLGAARRCGRLVVDGRPGRSPCSD
jgi:tRNA(Ile)-lysidine synthase